MTQPTPSTPPMIEVTDLTMGAGNVGQIAAELPSKLAEALGSQRITA